ncbi:hypothetical protein GCM10009801_32860 [Streptomyces albiaxialis]|uniref:Transposase n=1 Tax=Streptomyces albiaxialis TaxID=329523 RepID=A0ABP5HKF1_9ACTN
MRGNVPKWGAGWRDWDASAAWYLCQLPWYYATVRPRGGTGKDGGAPPEGP